MTYVMSDIHGHRPRFDAMLQQIDLQPEDKLYVLGDVIDRNPHGLSVLYQLMRMPNATMLLGNHEHMMLKVLAEPEDEDRLDLWYHNGGEITHDKWKRLSTPTRQNMIRYLMQAPVNVSLRVGDTDYLLVHGAPEASWNGDTWKYDDATMYAVWERLDPDVCYAEDQTIIFGHTPTLYYQHGSPMRIWHGERMIGIDCGSAYASGRLACLRLEDMQEFYAD